MDVLEEGMDTDVLDGLDPSSIPESNQQQNNNGESLLLFDKNSSQDMTDILISPLLHPHRHPPIQPSASSSTESNDSKKIWSVSIHFI